jgi:hypothetical protein
MVGRKNKIYSLSFRSVFLAINETTQIHLGEIQIQCPDCGSINVTTCGTRVRKNTRVEGFRCLNPACQTFKHKVGRQFILTSSKVFQDMITLKVQQLCADVLHDGEKYSGLAKKYQISPAEISQLRSLFQNIIADHLHGLELVEIPQPDKAIALDETFLRIEGTVFYVILATGYTSHKALGVKVSKTRSEQDIREVFDEADRNTCNGIATVTADALNATQAMVKNLGWKITLIIHKHAAPYDKVVIRHFTYSDMERITGEIGVKSDIFTHRGKREYFWREIRESLLLTEPKKIGRPLGSKTVQKKKPKRPKKKRGRKGLFTVFKVGKKAYLKVDPARSTLRIGHVPAPIAVGLQATFDIFARMSIQNNLSENLNSVIKALFGLSGPKQPDSIIQKIRIALRVRNQPTILGKIEIKRQFHGQVFLKGLTLQDYTRLVEIGWKLKNVEKIPAGGN